MLRHIPHETAPRSWTATAIPVHRDWGSALHAAQGEVRDLVMALSGEIPDTAQMVRAKDRPGDARADPSLRGEDLSSDLVDQLLHRADAGGASGALLEPLVQIGGPVIEEHRDRAALRAEPLQGRSANPADVMVLHPKPNTEHAKSAKRDVSALLEELEGQEREILRLVQAHYGDIWLRDMGPMFAETPDGWRALAFRFNGWGGKYVYAGDDRVAEHIARLSDTPLCRLDMVGEPGAIEFDGEGTLIATRRCLLNPNRNPNMSVSDAERLFRVELGIDRVLWN